MTRPEDLASAQNSFKEFKTFEQATASSSSSSKDESSFQTAFNLLENLKVALTHLTALPPLFEQTKSKKEELLLARELLEMSVILCARADDEMSFERNFCTTQIVLRRRPRGSSAISERTNLLGIELVETVDAEQNRLFPRRS